MPLDFDMAIEINKQEIFKVENVKYLGIVLDDKLSWKLRIAQVKKEISEAGCFFSGLRHYLTTNSLKLHHILIYLHLTYAITGWRSISKASKYNSKNK